jgi:hypothetical protein
MFTLPVPAIAPHTQTSPTVLPQRNLLRQLTWSLPSGQSTAAAIGVTPLSTADLADIGSVYAPFATGTPLWYYPFLGADLVMGPTPDTSITGNRTYTRSNFLYYAGVVQPGTYR